MRGRGRLRRFLALPGVERRLLVRALVVLAAARAGLWLLPFSLLRRLAAGSPTSRRPVAGPRRPEAERVAWAVATASRWVPRASCLVQALGAQALLRRLGHPGRLRIGVARDGTGRLLGHAWVEDDEGILVGAGGAEGLTPMPALEGRDG